MAPACGRSTEKIRPWFVPPPPAKAILWPALRRLGTSDKNFKPARQEQQPQNQTLARVTEFVLFLDSVVVLAVPTLPGILRDRAATPTFFDASVSGRQANVRKNTRGRHARRLSFARKKFARGSTTRTTKADMVDATMTFLGCGDNRIHVRCFVRV